MSFPIPELEFLRSGYFVVKLFSSRHYVYCFRFEMDMFWSLWLGRQYKKLLTDSQTPINHFQDQRLSCTFDQARIQGGQGPPLPKIEGRKGKERKEKEKGKEKERHKETKMS